MAIAITPLAGGLGAEVGGLDLAAGLDAAASRQVHRAWLDHGVLLFRGQRLDDRGLCAFSRRFGELEPNPRLRDVRERRR